MSDIAFPSSALGMPERMWRSYAPLLVLWLTYYIAVQLLLAPFETPVILITERFFPMYTVSICGFIAVWAVTIYFRFSLSGHLPRKVRWQKVTGHISWAEVLGPGSIPPIVMVFTIMGIFKSFKPHIPDLNPFSWDATFIAWDRFLFFGYDGWQLTHALVTESWMTRTIDWIYLAWFVIVLSAVLAASFSPMLSRRRMAFLMTFNLNWMIAGSLFAVMFSSVGPVFMDRLTGDQTFVPLIEQLNAAHADYRMWTVEGIDNLWNGYIQAPEVVRYGISAFPSLHVCMSMLVLLYLSTISRKWAIFSWVFFSIVVFGSVHLGWHYLVDGIAGSAICYANWRGSLWFAGWWLREAD